MTTIKTEIKVIIVGFGQQFGIYVKCEDLHIEWEKKFYSPDYNSAKRIREQLEKREDILQIYHYLEDVTKDDEALNIIQSFGIDID